MARAPHTPVQLKLVLDVAVVGGRRVVFLELFRLPMEFDPVCDVATWIAHDRTAERRPEDARRRAISLDLPVDSSHVAHPTT